MLLMASALAAGAAGQAGAALTTKGGNIYTWPDLGSGMWAPDMSARYGKGSKLQLKPEAAAAGKARAARNGGSGSCSPMGPIGMTGAGFPLKFYYSPGEIIIMSDMDQLIVRHVYMDGRTHKDADESYNGHSIGHWEGKSLVIDTVALSPKVDVGGGVPASPQTHVVERYTLVSPNRMHLQFTVTDPITIAAPYVLEEDFIHHADWAIEDTYCGEGNRDAPDANGNQALDLRPPQ